MSETLYVTPAQVLAAKLALELSEEAGEAPDEAIKAIANAQVVAPEQSASSHRSSSVNQALLEFMARVQRIEHQLQELHPEASGQERSQPSDLTLAGARPRKPWDRVEEQDDSPLRQFEWDEEDEGSEDVGSHTGQRLIGVKGGTTEEQEEAARIIAEYERQRERQRGQEGQNRDRDTDGPSGGLQR